MLPIVKQYKNLFRALMVSEFVDLGGGGKTPDGADEALATAIEGRDIKARTPLKGMDDKLRKFIAHHSQPGGALTGRKVLDATIEKFRTSNDVNTVRILTVLKKIGESEQSSILDKGLVNFFKEWVGIKEASVIGRREVRNQWEAGVTRDGADVVSDLRQMNFFLSSFNKTYGEKTSIFSNKNGIVGMLWQLADPDIDRLRKQLQLDDDSKLIAILQDMGVAGNRIDALTPALIRFGVIAAAGFVLSGGTSVALTALEINIGTEHRLGPDAQKILDLLGRSNSSFTQKYRRLLISKETTVGDIDAVFSVLNEEAMMPNNLKRFAKELFDVWPIFEWFHDIFPTDYGDVKKLILQFQNQGTTIEQGESLLRKIYRLCLKQYRAAKVDSSANRKEVSFMKKAIEGGRESTIVVPSTGEYAGLSPKAYYERKSMELSKADRETDKFGKILGDIGIEVSRIVQLNAKKVSLDPRQERSRAVQADFMKETKLFEDGITRNYRRPGEQVTPVTIARAQLENANSYGPTLPTSLNRNTSWGALKYMMEHKVNGDRFSMAANLMSGVEHHYGIDFTSEEFTEAFLKLRYLNPAEKQKFNTTVLSNTGRLLPANSQGTAIQDEVAVMVINGTQVYLKKCCTNVITIVNDLPTTIEMAVSVPIVFTLSTGVKTSLITGKTVGSTPIEGEPIHFPPPIGGQPNI